jgi:hypothetical protein
VIDDEATIDLDQVRARLWRVFAAYPFHLAPETDATMDVVLQRRVKKTRLETQTPADAAAVLRGYCAEPRALKHFLPRLLDLSVAPGGKGALHFADVLAALRRHDHASWPQEERQIVDLYLAAHGLRPRGG